VFTAQYGLNILYITEENFRLPKRVTLLRFLFTLDSLRLSGFNPWSIHVRYVLSKVALGQAFLQVFLSVSNHHCSIFVFTLILLYQREKGAWPGNLQTEEWSFYVWECWREECVRIVYCQAADGCVSRHSSLLFLSFLLSALCVTNCFSLSVAYIQLEQKPRRCSYVKAQ